MKTGRFLAVWVFFIAILTLPTPAPAEQGTLSRCQGLQDQIDRYSRLRRMGGRSARMSAWQKRRNHYKTLFSRFHCRLYRGELIQDN